MTNLQAREANKKISFTQKKQKQIYLKHALKIVSMINMNINY